MNRRIFTAREAARDILTEKISAQQKGLADPNSFSTFDRNWIIQDAEFRLRYLDCAPDGANHLTAPLQGAYGVPCGESRSYAVGPSKGMRNVIEKRTGESWMLTALRSSRRD